MRQWICLVGISIGVVIVVLEERKAEALQIVGHGGVCPIIFCLAVRACWWGGAGEHTLTLTNSKLNLLNRYIGYSYFF